MTFSLFTTAAWVQLQTLTSSRACETQTDTLRVLLTETTTQQSNLTESGETSRSFEACTVVYVVKLLFLLSGLFLYTSFL